MTQESAVAAYRVTVLLLEQFAMIAFTSTLEPLREANSVLGRRAFDWTVVSHDGRAVTASNGLSLNVDGSIHNVVDSAMVIVCSSFDPHRYITSKMLAWLRKFDRQGALIGGVETGAYVLARAGLLDGCRAAIHWENAQSIIKTFPKVQLTSGIFEIDGRRFSAAGASAAMDMMLHFIGMRVGRHIAAAVAEQFIYNRVRGPESPQRLAAPERMNMRHPRLRRLQVYGQPSPGAARRRRTRDRGGDLGARVAAAMHGLSPHLPAGLPPHAAARERAADVAANRPVDYHRRCQLRIHFKLRLLSGLSAKVRAQAGR